MKKLLTVFVPGLSVGIVLVLVALGFRVGSVPQNAGTPPDTSLIDAIIRPDSSREPPEVSFASPDSPSRRQASGFLESYTPEGYTVFKADAVYGATPGMDVYGVYPGEDLPPTAVWTGDPAIEVYLYHEGESTDEPMTGAAVLVYPDGCGEEECRRLLRYAGEIFSFIAPGLTGEGMETLQETDAYRRLMDCGLRYSDSRTLMQPELTVDETFPAGGQKLLLASHETYRYIEIALTKGDG